ncbi:MAG TPA: helix-turn-helix domain-containing protein [Spirochaetota bacterium]|nr:helix-turn-helix domain-containing protein [Spirochaetota bacterium]HPQ54921.1 helix-turn-helix domain-containing protein [Spirochaetota bacterium]
MVSFFDIFIFWVFFLGFTISLTQAFKNIKSWLSIFFTFAIFSIGLWGLQIALYATRIVANYELISTFLIPVSFFAAASNPLRYQWLIQTGYRVKWWYYLVYTPSILTLLYLTPVILDPGSVPKEYLAFSPLISGKLFHMPVYYMILQLLYPLANIYQTALAATILIRHTSVLKNHGNDQQGRISREAYKVEVFITATIFSIVIGDIFSLEIIKFCLIGCALALFTTFQNSIKYPIYNKLMRFEIDRIRESSSKIKSLDVDSIINKLTSIMEQEKAFAVESITLKDLADELGLSVHQLSEIINKRLGKNFNSYINEYRINEAKEMLINEPERSVISIGIAVGFNAVSSFTSVFTKLTGCSPREYRKLAGKKTKR